MTFYSHFLTDLSAEFGDTACMMYYTRYRRWVVYTRRMSFIYHKLSTFHLKRMESNRQLYESRVKHSQRSENGMKHGTLWQQIATQSTLQIICNTIVFYFFDFVENYGWASVYYQQVNCFKEDKLPSHTRLSSCDRAYAWVQNCNGNIIIHSTRIWKNVLD